MGMFDNARNQARKAIELLYEHTCTIRSYGKYKDPIDKTIKIGIDSIPKYENLSCKVSYKNLSKNNQTETTNLINYETKLFIAPEIEIKQGDEIEVTQLGSITKYKAGEGFKYSTHQEFILISQGKA